MNHEHLSQDGMEITVCALYDRATAHRRKTGQDDTLSLTAAGDILTLRRVVSRLAEVLVRVDSVVALYGGLPLHIDLRRDIKQISASYQEGGLPALLSLVTGVPRELDQSRPAGNDLPNGSTQYRSNPEQATSCAGREGCGKCDPPTKGTPALAGEMGQSEVPTASPEAASTGFTREQLSWAVMHECSCGGGGPDDTNTCGACRVYHRLVTLAYDSPQPNARAGEGHSATGGISAAGSGPGNFDGDGL